MRIAIPVIEGKLSLHFGHCDTFALIDVDTESKSIVRKEEIDAPPHQPGLLPPWLAERGAQLIIAGGMGQRAINLFIENGIEVIIGAPCMDVDEITLSYLQGTLEAGVNVCDH